VPRQLGAVALPSAAVHAAVLTLRDLAGRILALACPRAGPAMCSRCRRG